MSQNKARTPFDDPDNSGVDVPLSKNTQPLPAKGSLLSGLQGGIPTGNIATSRPSTPRAPASPVAPTPVAPAPAAPSTAPTNPTARLKVPLPTVIGLAVTGGVLLATVVPMLVRRAIPTVSVNAFPTPIATPLVPGQAPEPPTLLPKDDAANAPQAAEPAETSITPSNATVAADPAESTPATAPAAGSGTQPEPAATPTPRRRPRPSSNSAGASSSDSAGGAAGPQVLAGGFSIAAPSGWGRRRSGSQTIWSGPGGSRLLVEESGDISGSPREDWEKLDRGFRKSYGSRYRSLGIRDTTLAGRPAAAWEFELTSKSGEVTRKLDIAIHANGKGYAVLGSAPAELWDEARSEIESAIGSFSLGTESSPGDDAPEPPARDEGERGF